MRPGALGRKNSLHIGSENAGPKIAARSLARHQGQMGFRSPVLMDVSRSHFARDLLNPTMHGRPLGVKFLSEPVNLNPAFEIHHEEHEVQEVRKLPRLPWALSEGECNPGIRCRRNSLIPNFSSSCSSCSSWFNCLFQGEISGEALPYLFNAHRAFSFPNYLGTHLSGQLYCPNRLRHGAATPHHRNGVAPTIAFPKSQIKREMRMERWREQLRQQGIL